MNHYLIKDNTVISFSGGRTSGFMLYKYLEANNGLPDTCKVIFCNTGKEHENTLKLVNDCACNWGVEIIWLEYDPQSKYKIVNYETASREGQPFEALIQKKGYLPNPVTRFCTVELKIRAMHHYLKDIGFNEYDLATGIRFDESRRAAKILNRVSSLENSKANMILPLFNDGITSKDVANFWDNNDFDLELTANNGRTFWGNCDLCFLKGGNQIQSLIASDPDRALWWAKMESMPLNSKNNGGRFRNDRPSYKMMYHNAKNQMTLDFVDETIDCFCGD